MSNAAVIKGKLKHWSPSQITLFRRCPRRWYFEKIARPDLREGDTPATNYGTGIHKELEDWMNLGKVPDSSIPRAAVAELPDRETRIIHAEVTLTDPKLFASGVAAKGFIDLLDATDATRPAIWDYKTRAKLSDSLSEAALATDPQMVTYANWALLKFPEATGVELNHYYLLRPNTRVKRPRNVTKRVSTFVPVDALQAAFEPIEATVAELAKAALATSPDEVPYNDNDCHMYYRPCPYLEICSGAKKRVWKPKITDQEQSVSEYLADPATSATPAPAAPTTTASFVPPDAVPNVLKIYVDCVPVKYGEQPMGVTRLEEEIERRSILVAAELKVADIHDPKLYGAGRTSLVAHFRKFPPVGIILATSGPLSLAVVEGLVPIATEVVRG